MSGSNVNRLRVLIVEDDYTDYFQIKSEIALRFTGVEIQRISSEAEFVQHFDRLAECSPHLIIVDLMLKWLEPNGVPSIDLSTPGDYRRAGLRLISRLSADDRTQSVPVLLCSNLGERYLRSQVESLPENVYLLGKDAVSIAKVAASIIQGAPRLPELLKPVATAPKQHRIFTSYSHNDRIWVERIKKQITPLKEDLLDLWDDSQLADGDWRGQLERQMSLATVALFLVSENFCASKFIMEIELATLLRNHQDRGVRVLWILLNACFWEKTPLAPFQCLNDTKRPLAGLTPAQRNKALDESARKIEFWLKSKSIFDV
jgi:TIR domain-containing protein